MRKTLPLILLLLTVLSACKKENTNYWTLKGVAFYPSAVTFARLTDTPFATQYGISAAATTGHQQARIVICYSNQSGIPADGTYSVIKDDGVNKPGRAEVMIRVIVGAPGSEVVYHSTGSSGSDALQSTPDTKNNNRLHLRGPGLTFVNGADSTDIGYVNVNLTQTN